MKFHIFVFFVIITLIGSLSTVSAQVDSAIGQITDSQAESFVGGISGDGRLVVFESTGNIATENPRNADGNREIFLFDYAQRRIFQITDTKSLLTDPTMAATFDNIKVEISNLRPRISNDGRWIVFGSNVNSVAMPQAGITPASFDAASLNVTSGTTVTNPLTSDGNTEIWLYHVPAVASVNLSSGAEIAITDLSAGTFNRVTNTPPSRHPVAGSLTSGPIVADDNRSATINNNGNYIAFVSNRDLVPSVGNASPDNNDEIFTFVRNLNVIGQITKTPRGTLTAPIFNQNPTISGNGLRVAFLSKGNNPIVGMTGGSNADNNIEIFYSDLNAAGVPSGANQKQITTTTQTNPGDTINILDVGRRMSRDGRYIAFDSYADLANENGGTNFTSFALYVFDTMTSTFRRITPRSDADATATASGGDLAHYPGFTDNDANGTPQTLVFETRLNIIPAGTVAASNDDGLNTNSVRPTQIYSYPLNIPAAATFTRLTKFPTPSFFLALTQPIPSDSLRRMSFTLGLTEVGTGNFDSSNEAYYFLLPTVISTITDPTVSFATGASAIPVSNSPVPTFTASPTPTVTPTPTPQTPSSVQGISPGMLAIVDYTAASNPAIATQTAVGSINRRFTLPIELNGVTMTINGAAVGLKTVSQNKITFVVPPGLFPPGANNIVYPFVINNNGVVSKGMITIVNARPDIFNFSPVPDPNGRARIFNVTNTVFRTEPFAVTTVKRKGGVRVPTVLRVFLTGAEFVNSNDVMIRVGSTIINGTQITTNSITREPGVNTFDFTLPPALNGVGDVPIIITITLNGVAYQSRLDDTAPRFRIL